MSLVLYIYKTEAYANLINAIFLKIQLLKHIYGDGKKPAGVLACDISDFACLGLWSFLSLKKDAGDRKKLTFFVYICTLKA